MEFKVLTEEVDPSLYLLHDCHELLRLVHQLGIVEHSLQLFVVFVVLEVFLYLSHHLGKHLLSFQNGHAAVLKVLSAGKDNSLVKVYLLNEGAILFYLCFLAFKQFSRSNDKPLQVYHLFDFLVLEDSLFLNFEVSIHLRLLE